MFRVRVAAGALLLLVLLVGTGAGEPPWFAQLAGRLHHLVIHFPIALLLFAVALELMAERVPGLGELRPLAGGLLTAGAWGSLVAAVSGLLLAGEGGYDDATLSWHRGLGIAVAVAAVCAAALHGAAPAGRPMWAQARRGLLVALVGLLVVTGHYGGSLAHGASYLTRVLPPALGGGAGALVAVGEIESRPLFDELIQPVLDRNCIDCHGSSKSEGGLILETRQGLLEGGKGGPIFVPGDPGASEIVNRTSASLGDPDRMPPEGRPLLTIGETELIRFWIGSGASFEQTIGDARAAALPSSVATALARISPAAAERRTGIYALEVAPAAADAIARARAAGFGVRPLYQDSPFLDVRAAQPAESCGDAELAELAGVAAQIAWLNLSRTGISDEGLSLLREMPHLTRLDLSGTSIGDEGLAALAGLDYLEHLNVYDTEVSDAGLQTLAGLERLRALYLWQTRVTTRGAERLRTALPELSVNTGASGGYEPGAEDQPTPDGS